MRFSKNAKLAGSLFLVVLMSNIPNVAFADHLLNLKHEMISTTAVLDEINRTEAERQIQDFLETTNVRAELLKQGLTSEEVTTRLASLSEQEVRQLAFQVKEARAGGDVLVTVILVLLIIFLIQRIF